MPSLRDEFDDPIRAAVEGLSRLGFDDEEVMAVELDADPAAAATVEEYLDAQFRLLWGERDRMSTDRQWETVAELFHLALPTGFRLDWKWHAHRVVQQANAGLERFGYRATVEVLAPVDGPGSLRSSHPQAFVVRLYESDDDEPVRTVPVRLPPSGSENAAVRNHAGAAAALNLALLEERGLEIVLRLPADSDDTPFAVLPSGRLDSLAAEFGLQVALFGDPLFDRNLRERGLAGYDPANAADHEAAFGVPEPAGTFRLESHADDGFD